MAFICTHDTEVNWVLQEFGFSLTEVLDFRPDESKVVGFTEFDNETRDSNLVLNPIALIPRIGIGDKGVQFFYLYSVFRTDVRNEYQQCGLLACLNASFDGKIESLKDEEKSDPDRAVVASSPKKAKIGRSRGEYALDPRGIYKLAEKKTEIFLNRITIAENELGKSTWELLVSYMKNRHDMGHSLAYRLANVPSTTFHRIRERECCPSKDTLFKLGVIIQLSLDEMERLLGSAGYSFCVSDKRELLIRKCFTEGVLNPSDVNFVLHNNNVRALEFGKLEKLVE